MPAAQTRSSASKQGPSLGAGSGGASDDEVVSQVGSLDGKDTVEPSRKLCKWLHWKTPMAGGWGFNVTDV